MNARTRHSTGRGLLIVLCLCSSPAFLLGMRTAAADSPAHGTGAAISETAGQKDCRGLDSKLARERADAAARKSQYRRAGQCYLIAGDEPRANLAFIKATSAESAAAKRQLAANANQVKQQFREFRQLREALASH
ncbi:MAG: hypothetical protein ACRET5_07545 [Steroidobacteraceae bacterium]